MCPQSIFWVLGLCRRLSSWSRNLQKVKWNLLSQYSIALKGGDCHKHWCSHHQEAQNAKEKNWISHNYLELRSQRLPSLSIKSWGGWREGRACLKNMNKSEIGWDLLKAQVSPDPDHSLIVLKWSVPSFYLCNRESEKPSSGASVILLYIMCGIFFNY